MQRGLSTDLLLKTGKQAKFVVVFVSKIFFIVEMKFSVIAGHYWQAN